MFVGGCGHPALCAAQHRWSTMKTGVPSVCHHAGVPLTDGSHLTAAKTNAATREQQLSKLASRTLFSLGEQHGQYNEHETLGLKRKTNPAKFSQDIRLHAKPTYSSITCLFRGSVFVCVCVCVCVCVYV